MIETYYLDVPFLRYPLTCCLMFCCSFLWLLFFVPLYWNNREAWVDVHVGELPDVWLNVDLPPKIGAAGEGELPWPWKIHKEASDVVCLMRDVLPSPILPNQWILYTIQVLGLLLILPFLHMIITFCVAKRTRFDIDSNSNLIMHKYVDSIPVNGANGDIFNLATDTIDFGSENTWFPGIYRVIITHTFRPRVESDSDAATYSISYMRRTDANNFVKLIQTFCEKHYTPKIDDE